MPPLKIRLITTSVLLVFIFTKTWYMLISGIMDSQTQKLQAQFCCTFCGRYICRSCPSAYLPLVSWASIRKVSPWLPVFFSAISPNYILVTLFHWRRLITRVLITRGVLIIATPYASGFDHFLIADEVQFKFDRCYRTLDETVSLNSLSKG